MIGGDDMKIISTKEEQETLRQIVEVKASIEMARACFDAYFDNSYREKHRGLPNMVIGLDVQLHHAEEAIDKLFEDA
jgi:hypothetical protein